MSKAIILQDADDAQFTHIITDGVGDNLVFDSVDDADMWVQKNARAGWCTRIVEIEE